MQHRLKPRLQPRPTARLLILHRPRFGHPRREFALQRERRNGIFEALYLLQGSVFIASNAVEHVASTCDLM